MIEFKLPSLGADMDEGKLLRWLVEPGQAVKKGDIVAVVDTSKAAVDIEIWFDATVQELLTQVGETIPVGTTMALMREPGEAALPARAKAQAGAPADDGAGRRRRADPTAVRAPAGAVPRAAEEEKLASQAAPVVAPARAGAASAVKASAKASAKPPLQAAKPSETARSATAAKPAKAAPEAAKDEAITGEARRRPRVSPAAGQLAAELGVALSGIVGSGAGGAITRDDVEAAAGGGAVTAAPPAPSASRAATLPDAEAAVAGAGTAPAAPPRAAAAAAPSVPSEEALAPGVAAADRAAQMRKVIGAAMARSKREIPHYYLSETIPMRAALEWLGQANAHRPVTSRLLPAVMLLKAVALAVADFPEMNGLYVGGRFEAAGAAHIGVAISLRHGGLVAPALHDVGTKDLDVLMRELADLVKRCRAGSLRSSEMADPTITVTNLGDQGVDQVHGVIYPPQVALVGFGRIVDRPWIGEGELTATPVVVASLAADHRVSDGHRGALFLSRLRDLLQRPDAL